jgi:carbohydrate binding protein with CBM4/9 domain
MPTLNATVYPNEAYVLVEVDWSGALTRDHFDHRTVSPGWGTPELGAAYAYIPANTQFSVSGGYGRIAVNAVNSNFIATTGSATNVYVTSSFSTDALALGADQLAYLVTRFTDINNYYRAGVNISTTGTMTLFITRVSGGVGTALASVLTSFTHVAGARYSLGFEVNGTQLRAKIWATATPEPLTWNLSTTDATLAGPGAYGVRALLNAGNTNPLPVLYLWDDFLAFDPNTVEPLYAGVTRRNTVTGEIVHLRPYVAYDSTGNLLLDCAQGLWWDTEPPLNVSLEYCAVATDVATQISQNCCFESGTAPWAVSGFVLAGTLTTSTTFAHEGLQSGLITPTGAVQVAAGFTQTVTGFIGTEPVTMSAWVLSPQGWNSVLLQLVVTYSDGTTETVETPVEILDDGEWRFLSTTFTPRKTITSAQFTFMATGEPPNTTLFYVDQIQLTQPTELVVSACETVTVSSESVWLKNPFNPCLDVGIGLCSPMLNNCLEDTRVSYVGHTEDSYSANTVLLSGPTRRRPVPVNRVRADAVSTLQVLTHDCAARDAVLDSNETGDPLLFQAPAQYCIEDRYISVGVLTDSRISVDQREPFRLISMPYAVVDRPEGPANGVCGARIDDLCDIYSSWNALAIAGLTWTGLLLGEASPNGPGQPDPDPDARTWGEVEVEFATWSAVEAGGTRDWGELRDGL